MSLEDLRQAFLKTAEATETNKDDTTVGVENVYPSPAGRAPHTIDAPWGEPGHADPFHNSDGVWAAFQEGRDNLLDRVFTQFSNSSKLDKKLISENFSVPGKPGTYESHSALLNHGVNTSPSLTERVKSLVGRR